MIETNCSKCGYTIIAFHDEEDISCEYCKQNKKRGKYHERRAKDNKNK